MVQTSMRLIQRQAHPETDLRASAAEACFSQVGALRAHDRYHPDQDREGLLEAFHPESVEALVLSLSRVTSAFYGLMLQTFADTFGAAMIDSASRRFFFALGQAKARAARTEAASTLRFFGDPRDVVSVLIAAIYGASPEYHFDVRKYEREEVELHVSGVDRYHRIATELDLTRHLSWPVLHPFFEGAAEALGVACEVESELVEVRSGSELVTRYSIRARAERGFSHTLHFQPRS